MFQKEIWQQEMTIIRSLEFPTVFFLANSLAIWDCRQIPYKRIFQLNQ
jgi:hypothetical protein